DRDRAALMDDFLGRRRNHAADWFGRNREVLGALNPEHRNTPALIAFLAQWADESRTIADTLSALLEGVPKSVRDRLPMADHLYLRLANEILGLRSAESAVGIQLTISLASDIGTVPEVLFLAHFWKAHLHWRRGEFDSAIEH